MIAANAIKLLSIAAWLAAFGEVAGDAATQRLSLQIAAPAPLITALTDRLASRLAARAVALDVTAVADVDFERLATLPPPIAEDSPLARVWLDGRDTRRALLFLVPRQGNRVLVRKVELSGGFDEVALVQTTYIIDRAVASLLVSEPIGVPQSQARAAVAAVLPATATAAPVVDLTPPSHLFRLGAFGGVGAWSGEAVATARLGIEASLQPDGGGPRRLGLAASTVVDPGFHVVEAGVDLLARSLAFHLYATATWRAGRAGPGGIGVGIGPALIVTRIDPTLTVSSATETARFSPRNDFDPAVGGIARWELPVGRSSSVFVGALLDLVAVRARYAVTVQGQEQEQALFSPWLLRPSLVLGVTTGSQLR